MPTNFVIDGRLPDDAPKIGKKPTVNEALKEYARRRKQAKILELFGTVDFDPRYDYKRQRRRK